MVSPFKSRRSTGIVISASTPSAKGAEMTIPAELAGSSLPLGSARDEGNTNGAQSMISIFDVAGGVGHFEVQRVTGIGVCLGNLFV